MYSENMITHPDECPECHDGLLRFTVVQRVAARCKELAVRREIDQPLSPEPCEDLAIRTIVHMVEKQPHLPLLNNAEDGQQPNDKGCFPLTD